VPSGATTRFFRRPTTILAALVVVITAVAAVAMESGGTQASAPAARVGDVSISPATLNREVAVLRSVPAYAASLSQSSTNALAAPIDPTAVAAADGDPDDLRISLAPAGGTATRPYTTVDLQAAVLTRLIYVVALDEVVVAHRVKPDAGDLAYGRDEAELAAGDDASGAGIFSRLPGWYQTELSQRGADVAALVRAIAGPDVVTAADVQRAYLQRLGTDFTVACVRSLLVTGAPTAAEGHTLATAGAGTRDEGCAPLTDWAPDVAAVIRYAQTGQGPVSVKRGGRVALLDVTSRQQIPLSSVEAEVVSGLYAQYADLIDTMVEDELGLLKVTVAPQYGTYENLGTLHDVLPPDALTPPTRSGQYPTQVTSPPQQHDPFD
jgi:hypothetical protein